MKGTDPDRKTKKEKGYRGRDRVLSADKQAKLLPVLTEEMRRIVIIAVETGMRRGELMGLTWGQVDLSQKLVKLTDTKNGTSRDVPLTNTAITSFREQAHGTLPISGKVWSIGADRATSIFAEKVRVVELSDIRFHDLRHTAATRLAKVYQINDLAKILGHSTLDMTMRYYNPTGNELVNTMVKAGV
ncbi:MAG: site-specific integrase [Leptospirales bacterium]